LNKKKRKETYIYIKVDSFLFGPFLPTKTTKKNEHVIESM